MSMQRAITSAALVLAVCLSPAAAFAQAAVPTPGAPAPHQQNGITYVNGGVGQEEQSAMRAQRSDYNLQLTFATSQTGAYRSDVQLDIADAKGNNLVSKANTGPMFFAKLPPGTYRISAAAEGKTFKRTVRIGDRGGHEMTLHWENDSPDDPGPQE
jgi:opacity protein-like surface antigen